MNKLEYLIKGRIPGKETGIEIRKSICAICDPKSQCGLDLYIKDGEIIKVEGTKENPHSEGTLCSKGAATRQYVYNDERIKTPLKRVGPKGTNQFVPISWDEALDIVSDKLKETKRDFGPEKVAFYVGYAKGMRPYVQRLAHSFGSPNYLTESSTCAEATAMAWRLTFGTPAIPDVKNANCLLVWSNNMFYSNTTLVRGMLAAIDRGLKLIVVDPRMSPMANKAHIHLQLKPSTDGALALAIANVIINENLYDKDFVDNYTLGFEEFKEYVQEFSPEKGQEITGVPAEKIREAARFYATTEKSAFLPSASPVVHHTNGVQNYRAVMSLVALTGNYDKKGGNILVPPSWLGEQGGFITREKQFKQSRQWGEMAPRIGQDKFPVWCELIDQGQAIHMPTQLETEKPYQIKAIVAFGMNYRMWPDSENLASKLAELDFFVNVDIFMTDTCKYADIVLPACTSVERSELRCYPENYIIYTKPAIKPLYESRSDTDIIFDLANRLELNDPLFEQGQEAALDWILEPSGMTIAELKKQPSGMFVPNPIKYSEKKYVDNGFTTPSRKMEFKSQLLEKYSHSYGYEVLPKYKPSKYSVESQPEMAKEYPLILNTGSRLPMYVNSRTFRLSWTRNLRSEPLADIHPVDAEKMDIESGDKIRLATPKGEICVKANVTLVACLGTVHMYHNWPGANVNELIEKDYLDPISGYPGFKSLLCKIEKVI